MSTATSLEMQASVVGSTRKLLKQRLREAYAVLTAGYKKKFTQFRFEFENNRVLSDDGTIALQWRLRAHPDQPPSYNNQQTSRGLVFVVNVDNAR